MSYLTFELPILFLKLAKKGDWMVRRLQSTLESLEMTLIRVNGVESFQVKDELGLAIVRNMSWLYF